MFELNTKKLVVGFLALAIVCLGSAVTAKADSITVMGETTPALRATINITALSSGSITFTLTNSSIAPVTLSMITGIGFDLPGVITANTPGVCSGSCFNFTTTPTVTNSPGNVPQFQGVTLDFAVITGQNNFAGGNPPGISIGQTATFTITGNFTGLTQANFLNGAYVRFQAVAPPGDGSDVAHDPFVPPQQVPEPGTLLLLGVGLSAVGVWSRLRVKR